MTRFADLKIGSKLLLLEMIFLLGFALFGFFSFSSLNRVKVSGPIYAGIVQNQEVIQDILPPPLYVIESRLNALQMMEAAEAGVNGATLSMLAARAAELRKGYEQRYAFWMKGLPEGELKRALERSHRPAMEFYRARDDQFIPAIMAGAVAKAKAVDAGLLQPKYEAHRILIDKAVATATRQSREDEAGAAQAVSGTVVWLLAIGLGTASLTLLFGVLITRSITVPLESVSGVALDIAEGKLDPAPLVGTFPKNEIGAMVQALNMMTSRLSDYIGKLRASEMKYRIVAENTYDWEFWRTPDGGYFYSSPSCERVSGYKPADFAADQSLILRLLLPEDREAYELHQRLTLRPDCPPVSQLEYRLIAADGTMRWISHVCIPVFDEGGNFLGKRGTNRDVTAQKKAEADLVQAKEQAEAASRAKSAFISSMSHELRTPLNAIIGYTQILLHDDNLSETQRNQLDILHRSGAHLLTLINDILDMGKIESGKMEVESLPFDLPSLVRQLFELTRSKAEGKGLAADYHPGDAVPANVKGDARKVQQILLNLLDNAVRFTRSGGVTLTTEYEAGIFRCEVADTGVGIAADNLEAIFEPFTQLEREGQVTEGTGLGLTLARHLVTLMGGKLEVESEPGKGSAFRIELRLPAAGEGEVAQAVALPLMQGAQAPAGADGHGELEVPPPEKLKELYDMAMLGDMRRIRTWAERIIESDTRYRRFAAEVRELAGAYKAKAITTLVQQYLPKKGGDP